MPAQGALGRGGELLRVATEAFSLTLVYASGHLFASGSRAEGHLGYVRWKHREGVVVRV